MITDTSTQNEFQAAQKRWEQDAAATSFQLALRIVKSLRLFAVTRIKIKNAMSKYVHRYHERHGSISILEMARPVPLRKIYTAARVIAPSYLYAYSTPERMEQSFKKYRSHRATGMGDSKREFELANQEQYLIVLGAPGAGKSTFLRRLGMEALLPRTGLLDLRKRQGSYRHEALPVFIEIRDLKKFSLDLTEAIKKEFAVLGFPRYNAFVDGALREGKLLILLDGLDEVNREIFDEAVTEIRNFVDRNRRNRFVISSRTAFYKNFFNRFTTVIMAEFDDVQIEQFCRNWFCSPEDKNNRTGERVFRLLNQETNSSAKELARNPLLLTFLCMVYDASQGFPSNRAALYRDCLDVLLRRWAAERRVHKEPIHGGLHPELELDLLSEIAESAFREDRFFFDQGELVADIAGFMEEVLNGPRDLDPSRVLEEIEVRQGLLTKRARGTYSFSHLTIQEYLVARSVHSKRAEFELIQESIFEERWREIFLLLSGMQNADRLLLEMAERARDELRENEILRDIAVWLGSALDDGRSRGQQGALRRCLALFIIFIMGQIRSRLLRVEKPLVRSRERALEMILRLVYDLDIGNELKRDYEFVDIVDRLSRMSTSFPVDQARMIAELISRRYIFSDIAVAALWRDIDHAEIAKTSRSINRGAKATSHLKDSAMVKGFDGIKINVQANEGEARIFVDTERVANERVSEVLNRHLGLKKSWRAIFKNSSRPLEKYLYACHLILDCKKSTYRLTGAVWDEVLDKLFCLR